MRFAYSVAALLVFAPSAALAVDVSFSGYLDVRAIAPTDPVSWVKGGLGKFRYGSSDGNARITEGVLQVDATITDGFSAIAVLRGEPETPSVVDALETYLRYTGADSDLSWSVKTGAFFPSISLENDDLGWASPYTLTPSAINSWIGDELRSIGSEATLRWQTPGFGTISAMGALICCNDEAGILMADRGWSMDDRPTGLFERVRLPDATMALFHSPLNTRTGLFDEIDGRAGWYGGLSWQMPGIIKLSVVRYDNDGDPAAVSSRDTAWETKFWSFGARTDLWGVTLIAQQMSGTTAVMSRGADVPTKFQSGFLLASHDWGDWRASAREDLFQTRRIAATPSPLSEDGSSTTASLSWSGEEWLRLTGEVIAMHSRRGEYARAGLADPRDDTQFQLDARFFF